jgi:hypothetical protein
MGVIGLGYEGFSRQRFGFPFIPTFAALGFLMGCSKTLIRMSSN